MTDEDPPPLLYLSQAQRFESGIVAFEPYLSSLHAAYRAGTCRDWPLVLLSTLLQTTAVSVHKLMPPAERTNDAVDLRSIASLLRNLVDTHDSIHALCGNPTGSDEWNLSRDIMGFYLSHQIQGQQNGLRQGRADPVYTVSKDRYWQSIDRQITDPQRKRRIRDGRTIFVSSRRERVQQACGDGSTLVLTILDDLSTFVHSIPPSLWLSALEAAFADDNGKRDKLAIWLRMGAFYFANAVRVTVEVFQDHAPSVELQEFLARHTKVFDDPAATP